MRGQANVAVHAETQRACRAQQLVLCNPVAFSFIFHIGFIELNGPMVYRLALWTLNPAIAVQIRVGPMTIHRI